MDAVAVTKAATSDESTSSTTKRANRVRVVVPAEPISAEDFALVQQIRGDRDPYAHRKLWRTTPPILAAWPHVLRYMRAPHEWAVGQWPGVLPVPPTPRAPSGRTPQVRLRKRRCHHTDA